MSGNLLRCPDIHTDVKPITRYTSNLIKYFDTTNSDKKSEEPDNLEVEDNNTVTKEKLIIKTYTLDDMVDAVEIIKKIIKKEVKIKDLETASLIYHLLEKQSISNVSIVNLFEVLKTEDPHRTRSFRRDIINPLREFFPTKPVARLFTEAMSKEWKAESRTQDVEEVLEEKKGVSKKFNNLINFNTMFPKWLKIFTQLKRKTVGASNLRLDKLRTSKTGSMVKCFIYMLFQTGESEREFKTVLGNTYQIFKAENEELFSVFKDLDLKEQNKVFIFFQSIYYGLLIYEILVQDCSILKLEGSSAQSICPDKRVFAVGHMRRAHQELVEELSLEFEDFIKSIDSTYNAPRFSDFTFNRKDVLVKYMQIVDNKKLFFTYHGQVETIDNLKCTLEESF
ncbi:MAG: hypothetical protein COB02_02215 [Candidatus Cloacimonadota bacterium]|nr:MAG: hypothetical protein COB02_02215 [Candidatus Cloacimonadota bacterium]